MRILFFLLFTAAALLTAAQNCTGFYYLQNGKTVEMTVYKKNGKVSGKNYYAVSDVSTSGGVTKSTVKVSVQNENGKERAHAVNQMQCKGGELQIDMKMFIPQENLERMEKSEAVVTDSYLPYPASMREGESLPDGHFNLDLKMESGLSSSVVLDITERKVTAKESITSPAGTWDCFKISSNTRFVMKMGGIGIPMKFDLIEWFAPGFGVVKSESKYGSTLITAVQ